MFASHCTQEKLRNSWCLLVPAQGAAQSLCMLCESPECSHCLPSQDPHSSQALPPPLLDEDV